MMLEMRSDEHMDFHEKLPKFLSDFNKQNWFIQRHSRYLDHAESTFHEVWTISANSGLHAGKVQFKRQNKE
jgi:hypothetical protein